MPGELDRILQGTHKPKPQPSEDEQQDLDAYVVYPKGAYALDIEDGGKPVISFQYVFLSIWSQFTPESFWFIFKDGDERVKLTVKGRNLRDMYNRIADHCVRKIRRADRDFAQDGKAIVTEITITSIEEEK